MDNDIPTRLKTILTSEKFLAIYHLNFPDPKGTTITGTDARKTWLPNPTYAQTFYDLTFHDIYLPLSTIPLPTLLVIDIPSLVLPAPDAPNFPEQAMGLIIVLDQTRVMTSGSYNARYTRCFFDHICEKLTRQLVALPGDVKPDGKTAWMSRGYTFEQWLTRVLMVWAPLIHSESFMVQHRQSVKSWIHSVRAEVESHYSVSDPFAHLEASDDLDLTLFPKMIMAGPPEHSPLSLSPPTTDTSEQKQPLHIWDYAFFFIRILNAHFPLTDYCGHYPYATEWHGRELTERDREYLEKTDYALYDRSLGPVFEQVRGDVREGVWQPLRPIERFEKGR